MSADWREMCLLDGKDFLASTQNPSQTWFEKYIPPEEQSRVMAAIEAAIRIKSTFELEHRVIQLDGTIGWTFSRAIPLLNAQDEIVEWLGAARNVTARKQAELSAELLAIVTQNLAEATCVEEIIQTVGEQLNRYLQVSNCAFVEINERANEATIDHCWHGEDIPSLAGVYRLSEFVTGEFFQTAKLGQTIIVQDVETDPCIADPEQFAALKIGSFINVPLIQEGEWKFTLGIYHQTRYNWRSGEIELMRELANRIWTKLERTRVETALRESEAKYRSLFNSIDEGYFLADVIFDENGHPIDVYYLETNPAAERIVGRNFAGRRLRDIDPNYEGYWYEIPGRVVQTGESERLEHYAEPDKKWYELSVFKVGDESSRRVAVLFDDITERKRREANLAFLADITEDFSRLSSANEIMQTVGAKIGAYLQITTCNFADVDEDRDHVTAHYGWSSPEVPSTVGTFRLSQYLSNEFEQASRAGEMFVICNTQTDPRTDAAGYAALNMHSFVTVPFHHNGRWTHYIAICDSQPRDWREDEIQLIEEISNRIFPRLERARAEEALRASEAKYRSLFESIDAGFCLLEVLFDETGKAFDYRFLEVNPAFEKQTGLVDVIGKTIRELMPEIENHRSDLYGRIALTGVPERFQNVVQEVGQFYDVYAFRIGEPQERKVAVLFNDISDRKQTEIALRESEERFRLMGDAVPQIVWITDSEGRVEFFNKQWSNYTGVPYEPTTAAEVAADFVHPDDGALTMEAFNEARRTGGTFTVEHRIRAADGTYRWFLVKAEPYRHLETGEIIRWFGASVDIHDRKQAEAEREQLLANEQQARAAAEASREEAHAANRVKDEFLAVLSHELRSPLNPILGWSTLLLNGKLDATKTTQALTTIQRNAKLQSELIEDLLDVSRILRGKLSLNVAPVNLASTIQVAMETVRLAAEAKPIQIEATFAPDVGLVTGDSTRLQQIIWNILSNAVKFTPAGGRIEISLSLVTGHNSHGKAARTSLVNTEGLITKDKRPTTNYAQITVSDTGQGITPDFVPYVFDYFRQADAATTRKFGGLGLGLAIVRYLVELHGGTVSVASPGEGQGATFTVLLPLMTTASETNQAVRSHQQSLDLSGTKILVVDDEPDTRELVAFVLEQQGAAVTAASSAHEALLVLSQAKPDVLVSDIGMPGMDGYMLIQQVRRLAPEEGGHIRAIALTAYAGDTNKQQVLAAGFQKHISKPIEPEELVQAIAQLVHSI